MSDVFPLLVRYFILPLFWVWHTHEHTDTIHIIFDTVHSTRPSSVSPFLHLALFDYLHIRPLTTIHMLTPSSFFLFSITSSRIHRHLKSMYFTVLERFSVSELLSQTAALSQLEKDLLIDKKAKSRRRTLRNQKHRIAARIKEIEIEGKNVHDNCTSGCTTNQTTEGTTELIRDESISHTESVCLTRGGALDDYDDDPNRHMVSSSSLSPTSSSSSSSSSSPSASSLSSIRALAKNLIKKI